MVRLPYRITQGRGEVAATITVLRDRTTLAHLRSVFSGVESGRVYARNWKAPKAKTKGTYRFCITLRDRAHHDSTLSCARIRLR